MADTIIGYVKQYGDYTFREKPMNDVDSLVLCQFAYLKFDGMVPGVLQDRAFVSIRRVAAHADYDHLFADTRYEKSNRALFEAMLRSRRFSRLKMNYYINIVKPAKETQFSAITFLLEDGTIYLAYRGTDETIVGWKEDFNMAYLFPIPGQTYSIKYLEVVAGKVSGSFYVGGHSKGGNLAICAAMQCAPEIQERIIKIYNMDGPGFRPEVLKQFDYDKIAGRIVKILPHSSLIGMIFETDTRYHVVESKGFGLLQHDPYTWLVKDGGFVYAKDLYRSSKFTNSTINEWVLSLDEEHLKTFVNTVFQVLSASQAKDLIEFTADWRKSMNGVIAALREVDDETKKILKDMIKALAVLGRKRLINTQLKGVGGESTKQKISPGSVGRRSVKKGE